MDEFEGGFEDLLAEAEQFDGGLRSSTNTSILGAPASQGVGAPQGRPLPSDLGGPLGDWGEDSLLDDSQVGSVSLEEQLRALQSQRFSQGASEGPPCFEGGPEGPQRFEGNPQGPPKSLGKRRRSVGKRPDALSVASSAAASPLSATHKRRKQQQPAEAAAADADADEDEAELAEAAAALRPPVPFFDLGDAPCLALAGPCSSSLSSGGGLETEEEAARRASLLPQQPNNGVGTPSPAYLRSCLYTANIRRKFPAALLAKAAAAAAAGGEQQQQQQRGMSAAAAAVAGGALRVLPPFPAGGGSVGVQVYVPLMSKEEQRQQLAAAAAAVRDSKQSKHKRPMEEILREIMESQAARRQEAAALQQQHQEKQQQLQEQQQQQQRQQQQRNAARQWVDLYRPKKLLDLLCGGGEARVVFRWLLAWRSKILNKERCAERQPQQQQTPADEPKVLLLGGPPGAGKTTLLEVAARHFGFELIAVNASDNRSASQLLPLLKSVASSGDCYYRPSSSSGSSSSSSCSRKKPVLLLLDEIDGLSSQAAATGEGDAAERKRENVVQAIVKLLQQRDSKDKPILKRPIACICNDMSARVLHPLRPFCEVVWLGAAPRQSALARLRQILKDNKCRAEANALEELLDRLDGDLRAALNALQLLARRALSQSGGVITMESLASCNIQKDSDATPQAFLNTLLSSQEPAWGVSDLLLLWAGAAASLDVSLVAGLLAEGAPQFISGDSRLHKVAYLTRLLAVTDQQAAAGLRSSDYSLLAASLLPSCLFARFFCLAPPPSRCLYTCPAPPLSMYRLAAAAEQQRRACVSAAAAAAAATIAAAPAATMFLATSFAVETVSLLVRLALPFPSEAGALLGFSNSSSSSNQGPRGHGASGGQDVLQQLSRLLTGEKKHHLRGVAVGCLYTSASEPRALCLAAQRAALLTAYGLQLVQHKQERDAKMDGGVSLQRFSGVTTSFRLEPPLHLLLCLCDCRIQQQEKLQRRYGSSRSSSSSSNNNNSWYVGYATSRQLTATGAARGLRDSLSTFRRCSSSSSDSLQQQQHAVLQHPLYGVSDASCRLVVETRRLLSLKGSGPTLLAAVLSLWGIREQQKQLLLSQAEGTANGDSSSNRSKQQQQQRGAAAEDDPVAAALAALSKHDFFKAQHASALAVAKTAVIRKQFFVAPQTDDCKSFQFKPSASKPAKPTTATAAPTAATTIAAAAAPAATKRAAAVAAAAACSVSDEPRTPKKSAVRKLESVRPSARGPSGEAPPGAHLAGAAKRRKNSLWCGENSPLKSPFKKRAEEQDKMLRGKAVFSALSELIGAPTNGYLKFLQGRCNAVKLPVTDELFL